jgi:Ser/Thr protein kinase RdoA (MazF antagonist)
MKMGAIKSSYLASVGYDEKTSTMAVRFTDGALIHYHNVSVRTYRAVVFAKSPGEKFTELVRDKNTQFTVVKAAA